MKLNRFISSAITVIVASVSGFACGPFEPLSSNPFKFHFYQDQRSNIDEEQREENIRLWQAQTSALIPESDIKWAVYSSSYEELERSFISAGNKNQFIKWIKDHKATDIKEYLLLAKELEELRFNRVSQWYYPVHRTDKFDSRSEKEKFEKIFKICRSQLTGKMADRYALQYIRALMGVGKYEECISVYDKYVSKIPDNNLFKRMAKGYVAGCLRRIGKVDKSNELYAEAGDYCSLIDNRKDYFKTLVYNSPESCVIKINLNQWIGFGTRKENLEYIPIAKSALKSPYVVNRGDWLYLIAYTEETWNQNHARALKYVNEALRAKFSTEEMRNDALTMKLCLEAEQGHLRNDLNEYIEAFQEDPIPIYFYIVPALLKKGRLNEALLMANYGSYIEGGHQYSDEFNPNETLDNTYANTGFQFMLSHSARNIIRYTHYLASNDNLVKKNLNKIRHDEDYLNEIIGTLFLREGDYVQAENYLSRISEGYQENLNIKKGGYLRSNPWVNCYMPHDKWEYPATKDETMTDIEQLQIAFKSSNSSYLKSDKDAKLNFAHRMANLKKIMNTGSPDERGLARIRYALARYNSFNSSWALTQYWRGEANQREYQPWYWSHVKGHDHWLKINELSYLKELTGPVPDIKWLNSEMRKGMNELQSNEAKAEAQFLIGNYKTIAKRYPITQAGKYLSAHCDSWKEWL